MGRCTVRYALLNDFKTIIFIEEAVKGIPYFCEECKSELFIRNGPDRAKHYAHKSKKHCKVAGNGNNESTIHKYWKERYAQKKSMKYKWWDPGEKTPIEHTHIKEVQNYVLEKALKYQKYRIIPDVLLTMQDGTKIAIEICYKNKKAAKQHWIYKQLDLYAIEVNISDKGFPIETVINKPGKDKAWANIYTANCRKDKETAPNTLIKYIYELVAKLDGNSTERKFNYSLIHKRSKRKYRFYTTAETLNQLNNKIMLNLFDFNLNDYVRTILNKHRQSKITAAHTKKQYS
ncbi:MAG: competence protein CoiA family protein [Bacillota bacterium]